MDENEKAICIGSVFALMEAHVRNRRPPLIKYVRNMAKALVVVSRTVTALGKRKQNMTSSSTSCATKHTLTIILPIVILQVDERNLLHVGQLHPVDYLPYYTVVDCRHRHHHLRRQTYTSSPESIKGRPIHSSITHKYHRGCRVGGSGSGSSTKRECQEYTRSYFD